MDSASSCDLESLFDRMRHVCEQIEEAKTLEEKIELYAQGVQIQAKIKEILSCVDRCVVEVIGEDGKIEPFDIKHLQLGQK